MIGPAYEFTNEQMLKTMQAYAATAQGMAWIGAKCSIQEIKDCIAANKQFAYKYPKCVFCRAQLVVPGDPCKGCGRSCREAFGFSK